ncbi:MAG: hypothetical protein EOM40_18970 [Clostridia bacterium]|nr:hypothetical protein [Clostridia bacterium]NCC42014.1 hypothetical protein [Clostridia bacterium]
MKKKRLIFSCVLAGMILVFPGCAVSGGGAADHSTDGGGNGQASLSSGEKVEYLLGLIDNWQENKETAKNDSTSTASEDEPDPGTEDNIMESEMPSGTEDSDVPENSTVSAAPDTNVGAGVGTKKFNTVMESYREMLEEDMIFWNAGTQVSTGGMQFMLVDIDGNGIPELILKLPYDSYGYIGIYAYTKPGTIDVGFCDKLKWYYPGTGIYVTSYEKDNNAGEEITYAYLEDISERESTVEYESWKTMVGTYVDRTNGDDHYYWCGRYDEAHEAEWAEKTHTDCSEEEFNTELAALTGSTAQKEFPDDWYDNTAENREKYLK